MDLTRKSWAGWNPSQDRNGDPDYLLRMDNLHLDSKGAISLVRGFHQIGGDYADYVSDLYSCVINGAEKLYVGLAYGREIIRADVTTGTGPVILANGGTRPCFGDSLGQVYASSGVKRVKDNGTEVKDLGVIKPDTKPTVVAVVGGISNFTTTWTLIEGESLAGDGQVFVDEETLRGVIEASLGGVNTLTIGGDPSTDPGKDKFFILIQPENTSTLTKIRVELYCDDDNYYAREWVVDAHTFSLGLAKQSIIGCNREEFIRHGGDTSKGWNSVSKIRVMGEANSGSTWFLANEARFVGGEQGQLNGLYEYAFATMYDNGIYAAVSPLSPISDAVIVMNGKATVSCSSSEPNITEYWLYRRSRQSGEFRRNLDGTRSDELLPALLDDFYRVGVEAGGSFTDTTSDQDALVQNVTANQFLMSVKDITEPFVAIEGLFKERMLYVTRSFIYVSDRLNPDCVDLRCTLKAFGDPSEVNLWLKKVSNDVLVLGTTKDLYEINGSFSIQPDNTLDVSIRGMGEKYPPLGGDVAYTSLDGVGTLIYMAADGWRITSGSNSGQISKPLTKLFQGEDCYGVPPMAIYPGDTARYSVAVGRNKFYGISQHIDGTRRLFVYDFIQKYWRLQYIDPVYVHVTKTDRVLLGFGETGSGFNLFEMEFGDDATVDFDGDDHGQGFHFETVLDDNAQPRNRKDTFTLKLTFESGNQPISVYIARNEVDSDSDWVHLGDYSHATEQTTLINVSASNISVGFRYALKITNAGEQLKIFKLYNYTLEYEPRPTQLNHLRIPNTNLGTISRKRFVSFAFVIDTLGNSITFTPYIDNTSKDSSTVIRSEKLTYIHFFVDEQLGTDIGGILTGGTFEYYSLNLEETISEKLPVPTKFLVIPANDYGNPNRKRHTSYKFQINTRGADVQFTPIVDGTSYAPLTFSTATKATVAYYFDTELDVAGVDIGGILETLENTEFEFYGPIIPQDLELLPPQLLSFYIPTTDYGTPNRKRHTSYKFQIDTRGEDVTFTPIVDGVEYASSTCNTNGRRVHEHFFDTNLDIKGIDICGHLRAVSQVPFEFYKVIQPEKVEVLPPRLKSLYIPTENFGHAARKRIRTLPLIIDTGGVNVDFTPIVDGVALAPSTHNTTRKQTVYHYFVTDVFGTDYSGKLIGTEPFEFYGFGEPEEVEVLPVPKKYDQFQPIQWDKIGKLFEIRVRIIATGSTTSIPYSIYGDDNTLLVEYDLSPQYSGTITVEPNKDKVYTVQLPKNVNTTMFRLTLGPTDDPFHRYSMQVRVSRSGMESDSQWISLK